MSKLVEQNFNYFLLGALGFTLNERNYTHINLHVVSKKRDSHWSRRDVNFSSKKNEIARNRKKTVHWLGQKLCLTSLTRRSSPLGFIEGHNAQCNFLINFLITEESFHSSWLPKLP